MPRATTTTTICTVQVNAHAAPGINFDTVPLVWPTGATCTSLAQPWTRTSALTWAGTQASPAPVSKGLKTSSPNRIKTNAKVQGGGSRRHLEAWTLLSEPFRLILGADPTKHGVRPPPLLPSLHSTNLEATTTPTDIAHTHIRHLFNRHRHHLPSPPLDEFFRPALTDTSLPLQRASDHWHRAISGIVFPRLDCIFPTGGLVAGEDGRILLDHDTGNAFWSRMRPRVGPLDPGIISLSSLELHGPAVGIDAAARIPTSSTLAHRSWSIVKVISLPTRNRFGHESRSSFRRLS
ncbi:hypothetical protein N431DRAFT_474715 [Stipitochalara longipes BDJ]|nr:hypothetical protein N431DRAFT_474715 [Stipitochalara longipes BDJ]